MLTNRSAPAATITPVLVYLDVRVAVAWLEAALGFEEQLRISEDGWLVVAEAHGQQVPPSAGQVTHVIKIRVPDVDAAFRRAQAAGAVFTETPTTQMFGERTCTVEDPAGHRWELTQTVRDVAPEEWGGQTVAH